MKRDSFHNVDFSDLKIPVIVVYYSPDDFLGRFVARIFDSNLPTDCYIVKKELEKIREAIPHGFVKLSPSKDDDPVIVETWI